MPNIDPTKAQVLLLELQPEIVPSVRTVPAETLHRAVAVLRQACEALALPLTATAVRLGSAHPTLIDELDGLDVLERATVSAFEHPPLRQRLADAGRPVLAIGGVSSEIAIINSGLAALRAGYEVHLLVDACGGLDARTEAAAFRQLEQAGARASSVASFLTALIGDLGSDSGRSVMAGMARLWSWDVSDG